MDNLYVLSVKMSKKIALLGSGCPLGIFRLAIVIPLLIRERKSMVTVP